MMSGSFMDALRAKQVERAEAEHAMVRERQALREAAAAELCAQLPAIPMDGIRDTVTRLEQLLLDTPARSGYVQVHVDVRGGRMFHVPAELTGDVWWTSVCKWDRMRYTSMPLDRNSSTDALRIFSAQDDQVREALNEAWNDVHPAKSGADMRFHDASITISAVVEVAK